jgi:hypothetical protein
MLQEFSDRLAETAVSRFIQDTPWMVPGLQTVHILAIAATLTMVGFFNLRLAGLAGSGYSLSGLAARVLGPSWMAIGVLAVSGAFLIVAEPARELLNPLFRIKMLLLVVLLSLTALSWRMLRADPEFWTATAGRKSLARLAGAASILLLLAIIACGRWIAYVEGGA